MRSDYQFQQLISTTSRKSAEYQVASTRCSDAFVDRYGINYSDADADGIIDVLDYGGGRITVADCDEIMTSVGYPPLAQKEGSTNANS
jgi:hypothetical protein